MSKEKKEGGIDVLDQVKKIDKAIKAKLLIEKIVELKGLAREINELKEKCVITLEELGLSEKDVKRVIDYINELPEVKLSEKDKKALREEVQEEVEEEKVKVEKQFRDVDINDLIKEHAFYKNQDFTTTTSSTTDTKWLGKTTSTAPLIMYAGASGTANPANAFYMANVAGGEYSITLPGGGDGKNLQISL